MCSDYPSVYRFYHSIVESVTADAGSILKTDCFNEAQGDPIIHGSLVHRTHLLEIDPETIKKAESRFPELIIDAGDIRALPYGDASFDLVIDMSTIDHVPSTDYVQVLSEYDRVLSPWGRLLLVVWLNAGTDKMTMSAPRNQFYFPKRTFEGHVDNMFIINDTKHVFSQPGNRELYFYNVEKR